jgi:hypothetical protein
MAGFPEIEVAEFRTGEFPGFRLAAVTSVGAVPTGPTDALNFTASPTLLVPVILARKYFPESSEPIV